MGTIDCDDLSTWNYTDMLKWKRAISGRATHAKPKNLHPQNSTNPPLPPPSITREVGAEGCIPILADHGADRLVLAVPARACALRHPDATVLVGPQAINRRTFNLRYHTSHLESRHR